MKQLLYFLEGFLWSIKCSYFLWLHGPYGLAKIIEKMPLRFLPKYLRKYGATVGKNCVFERGLNIHRPFGKKPFENLYIGDNVYLGHNTILDLTKKITLHNRVIIASRCQIWTHASYYGGNTIENHQYGEHYGEVVVNEGALIYSNTVITHGVEIGKFAKVGASSLVNKSIPDNSFYAGVPIKEIQKKQ